MKLKKFVYKVGMANRIKEFREARGMSQEDLAKLVGTSNQQISHLELGKRRLTHDWMTRIADQLGCTATDLIAVGNVNLTPDKGTKPGIDFEDVARVTRKVPVWGTAAGGRSGGFQMTTGSAIDHVKCPPALVSAKDIYAFYVVGDSMSPRYDSGDLLFVNPHRHPSIGDDVVVQVEAADGSVTAYVKRLKKRDDNAVHLEQFNPADTIRLKSDTIKAIHKVMTNAEMFGG